MAPVFAPEQGLAVDAILGPGRPKYVVGLPLNARTTPSAGCDDPYLAPMSHPPPHPRFTPKQGQYLAFIYAYSRLHRRATAEADMQRHFEISPPSVHHMVLGLERAGLIRRQAGVARSIELLIPPEQLPILR